MSNIRAESFRARLVAGERLVGTFIKTPHPVVVEVVAGGGLDCLCIDAEHAPFDRHDIDLAMLAGRAHDLPMLVRVPSNDAHTLLSVLDLGACGVVLPHVTNAETAAAAAAACRYGHNGRGYAGTPRASGYSTGSLTDNMARANAYVAVMAQIEDADALGHLEEIAAVAGIDALFVGRMDLTVSLGASSPMDPRVIAAVQRICAAGRSQGRAVGMFAPDITEARNWIDAGASFFLLESEHQWMLQGARELARVMR